MSSSGALFGLLDSIKEHQSFKGLLEYVRCARRRAQRREEKRENGDRDTYGEVPREPYLYMYLYLYLCLPLCCLFDAACHALCVCRSAR